MVEIQWSPDSCQCIVIVDTTDSSLIKVIQKCQFHKDETDLLFFSTLKAHNASYNSEGKIISRDIERKRIKALGDPVKV